LFAWSQQDFSAIPVSISADSCVGNFIPVMGARNQVGIGLWYRPASLRILATQFQTRFLESIPHPIVGLKFSTLFNFFSLFEKFINLYNFRLKIAKWAVSFLTQYSNPFQVSTVHNHNVLKHWPSEYTQCVCVLGGGGGGGYYGEN
jgi:hypothetical protein